MNKLKKARIMAEGKTISVAEKIEAIKKSRSLDELPIKFWPDVAEKGYFFISYSHLDYKEVFVDLLSLEKMGLLFWYDRSMVLGEDWSVVAEERLSSVECEGVIFYLSPNALSSPSVFTEIDYAKKRGKRYFSINLPLRLNGKFTNASAAKIYASLSDRDASRQNIISEAFGDKIIYLPISETNEKKKEMIERTAKKEPLFVFGINRLTEKDALDSRFYKVGGLSIALANNGEASLLLINDVEVINPSPIPDAVTFMGQEKKLTKIENCAFANCRKMEIIKLPLFLKVIKPNAFYNCWSLETIDFPPNLEYIGSSAFSGCRSLKRVLLPPSVKTLKSWVFAGCKGLADVYIPKQIEEIGENSFYGCSNLTIHFESSSLPIGVNPGFNPSDCPILFNSYPYAIKQ